MEIINREALTERFGASPSFHDAEIYAIRLDSGQRSDGLVRLELDVHLFAVSGKLPDGGLNFVNHTLVTLLFEEVESLEISDFGPQNVLFELDLKEVHLAAGRQVQVTLPSSNGLSGSFRCRSVVVLDAVPFEPTRHSVYGR